MSIAILLSEQLRQYDRTRRENGDFLSRLAETIQQNAFQTPREVRGHVVAADTLIEALIQYGTERYELFVPPWEDAGTPTAYKAVRAKTEPEGAFVGVAVATVWVLKTFGGGVLAGAGTAAGKKLVDYFAKALRSRRLDPGPAKSVKTADKKRSNSSGKKGKKKS